jgi:hydrogenase maturation protease
MKHGPAPGEGGTVLVIGYGNTLRSDDGVGPRVAMSAASWARPDLTALAVHQLTPELAAPLVGAGLAIFVDARLAGAEMAVEVVRLLPRAARETMGHALDPGALLAMGQVLYGRAPRSWLVTIPVADLAVGEGLSSTAERGAAEALERIAGLAADWRGVRP